MAALSAPIRGRLSGPAEANLHPDWVSGISIGAVNSALVAGNPPEKRVARLREFWEIVSTAPIGIIYMPSVKIKDQFTHTWVNQWRAFNTLLWGAPGFFEPRTPPPLPFISGDVDSLSYSRFSVGAVHVHTGNFVYFDNTTHDICVEHVMASGSLPPGLPATEIQGERYWDGGLVSNTPLQWVLSGRPRLDTLAFQIDLWNARGDMPRNLIEAELRQKEIRFSSRTRAATDDFKKSQLLRRAVHHLLMTA